MSRCAAARAACAARAMGLALALAALAPGARAWGDEGHEIIASIAYWHLGAAARAEVDAVLQADPDELTAPDFVARSTWADRWRDSDRYASRERYEATRRWHYADVEIDSAPRPAKPDLLRSLDAACGGHPPLPAGVRASAGPAEACVVDKVEQFAAEWRSPSTPAPERLLALKFLIHFVGDLHQPLHLADDHDTGGNEVALVQRGRHGAANLHAYWDTGLVRRLGRRPERVAQSLDEAITVEQARTWSAGGPADWALDSFALARDVAYDWRGAVRVSADSGKPALRLGDAYEARALPVVREQLAKAGIRLAVLLEAGAK
ncbi:MAG: hypothetical protein KGL43_20085 [Burkholderiales bacterium]|nr:hypothetical protein [Burkholderiales bacterium]MDE2455896.1 hypothetical protein [Burkholderiales bacterium]